LVNSWERGRLEQKKEEGAFLWLRSLDVRQQENLHGHDVSRREPLLFYPFSYKRGRGKKPMTRRRKKEGVEYSLCIIPRKGSSPTSHGRMTQGPRDVQRELHFGNRLYGSS